MANAKLGLFPRRNAWHGIDEQAANVYQDREFDQAMADRIIAVRAKLWDLTTPRRVRLHVFDLAVLAFALRLRDANPTSTNTPAAAEDIAALGRRLETCRKRAKRAAIASIGEQEYRQAAERWGKFVSWLRYNQLSFKATPIKRPWLESHWQVQRDQLALIINKLLFSRYYEPLSDKQMKRIVPLLTSSSRRGRLHVGFRELIADPVRFSDTILSFLTKRVSSKRLPNAPAPAWQVITDRTDRFNAYQDSRTPSVTGRVRQSPLDGPDTLNHSVATAA